ncbi:MAG: Rv1733c family protein [Streptosporangiaceae bacterium]
MDEKTTGDSIEVLRPPGLLSRLVRLLLRRNELRRRCDRIEGAILVALSAAFLTATVAAGLLAGHLYQSQRAVVARLRPTDAVLAEPGPEVVNAFEPTAQVQARATWRLADGARRSGLLTARTAPAIDNAQAGATVTVWLNRYGDLQPAPPSQGDIVTNALIAGTVGVVGAALLLMCCYRLCRLALDRHRLARWGQAWAATGPRWTTRQ